MASRLLKLRWLVMIAAALSLVAAVACSADEAAEPDAPAAAEAASPAKTADSTTVDAPSQTQVQPDAPQAAADSAPAAQPDAAQPSTQVVPGGGAAKEERQAPDEPAMMEEELGYVVWAAPTYAPGELPSWVYDGPRPTKFTEAPLFAELVKKGQPCGTYHGPSVSPSTDGGPQACPAIADRLPVPSDILVMQPPYEIGVHGGTKRFYTTGGQVVADLSSQGLFATEGARVGKAQSISDDGRTYTFTLREGWKWSDGKPLNMEDFVVAWEDFNYNKELMPDGLTYPGKDGVTGNDPQFGQVDAWTWSLTYDTPNYTALSDWSGRPCWGCRGGTTMVHAPFFKQFHPKYADPADLKAQQEYWGVDDWTKVVFRFHPEFGQAVPVLGNFATPVADWRVGWGTKCTACPAGQFKTTNPFTLANPFFGAVDPHGNQLPYLDGAQTVMVESREIEVFRAMAGESDGPRCCWGTSDLPLWHKNMERGDFSIFGWVRFSGDDSGFVWNHDYDADPEIGRLVRTLDFRRAVSLSIDRDAINEVAFAGLATVQQKVPHPSIPYYPGPEWASFEIGPDKDSARALMTKMGYQDADGDGWLDRLDGTGPLTLAWKSGENYRGGYTGHTVAQMVAKDLNEVGIATDLGLMAWWGAEGFLGEYAQGKQFIIGPFGKLEDETPWTIYYSEMLPMYKDRGPSPKAGAYYYTGGEEGWAPSGPDPAFTDVYGNQACAGTYPSDVQCIFVDLQELHREGKQLASHDPRRIEIGQEIYRTIVENHLQLNIVGFSPQIGYVRNNVRNWWRDGLTAGYGHFNELHYFEDGIDNANHPGNRSKKYSSWSFALQ
jgi:peptide/nickel transport system substrate-binding protein